VVPSMAFCNSGEFIVAKLGNFFCNFVRFYFAININHYWNVRQENINEKGIIPDITVKGDSLEEFMKEVNKVIEGL